MSHTPDPSVLIQQFLSLWQEQATSDVAVDIYKKMQESYFQTIMGNISAYESASTSASASAPVSEHGSASEHTLLARIARCEERIAQLEAELAKTRRSATTATRKTPARNPRTRAETSVA